jgi:carboxylesterase
MPYVISPEIPEERKPYTKPGGPVGVLMLHGFMGSPLSSRKMADYLNGRGITMHCPLLPGHGHLPSRLKGVSRKDWLVSAENALVEIRAMCDEIFIIGHSMGSVLGAHLVAHNDDIRAMAMLAPLYEEPDRRMIFLAGLRYVMPWFHPLKLLKRHKAMIYQRVLDFDPTLDLDDPEVQAALPDATKIPTGALDEMRKMAKYGRKLWPRFDRPALILQGDHDPAVDPDKAQVIYDTIISQDKTIHYYKGSGHELMRPFDPAHVEVWPEIYNFIAQRSAILAAD